VTWLPPKEHYNEKYQTSDSKTYTKDICMAFLGRDTAVTGPFPKGTLLLETLVGQEALGMLYLFQPRTRNSGSTQKPPA
jgi:hypothetical protein